MKTKYPAPLKPRRSQIKRITRETQVLRFMRRSRNISMNKAGRAVGASSSTISHIEQGRMNLPLARIPILLALYGYSQSEYEEYVMGKALPVLDLRDECEQIVQKIDAGKLKTLHAVLLSLVG
jgi:transcriptional regulator with XRE-family HTH domain